jgi:hypothetical protein
MSDQLMGFCIFDVLLCVRGSAHSCIPLTIVPISSSFSQTIKELVGLSWYHLFFLSYVQPSLGWLVSVLSMSFGLQPRCLGSAPLWEEDSVVRLDMVLAQGLVMLVMILLSVEN